MTEIEMRVELEKVRIDLKSRAPIAARAMLFSGRDALKTEPRKIAEACLKQGYSTGPATEFVYRRMTGISLPDAAA